MKRKVVLLGATGMALVLGAGVVALSAIRRVPVRATFNGTVQRTQISTSPPAWSVKASGPLQILGIGVGRAEIEYDRVELAEGGAHLEAGATEGRAVFTLTPRDKAWGTLRWLTSPTANPNVVAVVGVVKITRGTGRFANTRGGGVAIGQGDIPNNRVRFTLEGFLETGRP